MDSRRGVLDERAGVHDDEIGRLGVLGRRHAFGKEGADQLVGIDLVLRAAEGLDVEAPRHVAPGYRRRLRTSLLRLVSLPIGGRAGTRPRARPRG